MLVKIWSKDSVWFSLLKVIKLKLLRQMQFDLLFKNALLFSEVHLKIGQSLLKVMSLLLSNIQTFERSGRGNRKALHQIA